MKSFLFLLISLFIMIISSEAAEEKDSMELDTTQTLKQDDKNKKKLELDTSETLKREGDKKLELDTSETLKRDGDKKLEFDSTATFDSSNIKSFADIMKKIKESMKKDPKTAEALKAKAKDVAKLLKESKKYKDSLTAKECAEIIDNIKTLVKFHTDAKVSDKKLYKAYVESKTLKRDIKKIKMRIASAKRNTPQAIKIRKFQISAKNYLRKAKEAAKQGKKARAQYYSTCAKIKQKAAKNYAKNPKIEEISKQQIKKAIAKYNHDYALETAARFRKRAKKYRGMGSKEKAEYYEKAIALKEKLAKAYAKDDKKLIKSIIKKYKALQETRY